MMKIWLSIVVPVYNVEAYLCRCLDSIAAGVISCGAGIEVLVIDDGSKDNSGSIAERYGLEFDFIKVFHKENAGATSARNDGIRRAEGEWIWFVDADDWIDSEAVSRMKQAVVRHFSAEILLFDGIRHYGGKETAWSHFKDGQQWEGQEILYLQAGTLYYPFAGQRTGIPLAAPWDKLYRRDFLCKNGLPFREQLKVLDDMVFNMEVFGKAKLVCYVKEIIYHYRYVPDSITNQYKPDRLLQDEKVWNYLEGYMARENAEYLKRAYLCRVVKSFAICCRLQFFSCRNKKRWREKLCFVKTVMKSPFYEKVFRAVRVGDVEWRLKPVVFCGRCHSAAGLYLLHLAQNFMRKRG